MKFLEEGEPNPPPPKEVIAAWLKDYDRTLWTPDEAAEAAEQIIASLQINCYGISLFRKVPNRPLIIEDD